METELIIGTENTGAGWKRNTASWETDYRFSEKYSPAICRDKPEAYIYTHNHPPQAGKTTSKRKKQKEKYNILNAVAFVKSKSLKPRKITTTRLTKAAPKGVDFGVLVVGGFAVPKGWSLNAPRRFFLPIKTLQHYPFRDLHRPVICGGIAGTPYAVCSYFVHTGFRHILRQRLNHYCPHNAAHWLQT